MRASATSIRDRAASAPHEERRDNACAMACRLVPPAADAPGRTTASNCRCPRHVSLGAPRHPERGVMTTHDQGSLAAELGAAAALQEAGRLEAARTAFAAVAAVAARPGTPTSSPPPPRSRRGLGARAAHVDRPGPHDRAPARARSPPPTRPHPWPAGSGPAWLPRSATSRAIRAGILDALEDARGQGDPVALAEALSLAHHCLLGPSTPRPAPRPRRRVDRHRPRRRRNVVDGLMGLAWRTIDLFLAGDRRAGASLRSSA